MSYLQAVVIKFVYLTALNALYKWSAKTQGLVHMGIIRFIINVQYVATRLLFMRIINSKQSVLSN